MLAIVAPGQGSQTPGFLSPWLADGDFADKIADLSTAGDIDLVHYGTEADADEIRDTAVAQPLLVASAIATCGALLDEPLPASTLVAGHSVGELAAAAIAGLISPAEAMRLVSVRGRAMAEAAALTPTSMTAVIGGTPDDVLAAIERAGLTPANNNGRGQIVAAGTVEQLEALAADPPRRARLIPLSVAGAFHTIHMEPAISQLSAVVSEIEPEDAKFQLLSNADGERVFEGSKFLDRIVTQVANPVRWDLCMETMSKAGVTGLLELTPAGTLTGIARRNLKGVEVFALDVPDQLTEAREFVAQHAMEA